MFVSPVPKPELGNEVETKFFNVLLSVCGGKSGFVVGMLGDF